MLVQQAETAFQQGTELLRRGRMRDAAPFLRAAIDLESEHGSSPGKGEARYLSYYGLCLSQTQAKRREALQLCRRAAELEGYRADVWRNLGRVALAGGRRGEAFRAFRRAARLDPGHPGIAADLASLGVRREPVLSFLERGHPLNVFLGRLRTAPRTHA
jgi:tetratricopeptide (TPR) repeat protein